MNRLRGLPICAGMEEEALEALAACPVVTIAAGRTFCTQGAPGQRMYLILSGHADILKYTLT